MLKQEILKIKSGAINKVEEKIEETYNEHKKVLSIFLLLLMDYFDKYSIEGRLSVNRYQRQAILKDLEKRIVKEIKTTGYKEVESNKKILEEIIKDTHDKHTNLIGDGKKIVLNPLFIQELIFKDYKGDSLENRILNNKRKLAGRLFTEFDKALLNNATLGEVSEKLKEVFKRSNYESYRLLMNEQGRVFDAVQSKVFNEESIEKVMWVSALCPNTCPYCEMMDGSIFELNDPYRPEIPAHVLCQCLWIPV